MTSIGIPLSVLDLASVYDGGTSASAVADTIATAVEAEKLGYERFWVAEHHGMPGVASSAPAVLIGGIAAATTTIRVGSGGVMLPNHSSLVIAEQFGTLVALHGDRIDLGLGRAPGTDGLTASVLRRNIGQETEDDFPRQVVELLAWFGLIEPLDNGIGSRIVAVPGAGDAPNMWLLGSSTYSAQLAGMLGLPFAFAHHFAGGDQTPRAFDAYREKFEASAWLDAPHSMVAMSVLVSDDAERLARPNALQMMRLRTGMPGKVPSLEETAAYPWTDGELAWVNERNSHQGIGDLDHVTTSIRNLVSATGANEVIVAPQGPDLETKLATLRALA